MPRHPKRSKCLVKKNYRQYPGPIFRGVCKGLCCWCGTWITKDDGTVNTRKSWHSSCVKQFKIRAWPKVTRRYIFDRDCGKCALCGKVHTDLRSEDWELEHEKPLALANGDRSYWEPFNLRVYCKKPCHSEKSKRDRKMISEIKKQNDTI